jgi:hypothetical protein
MTEHQQQPATIDPVTQERWDAWCDARIDNRIDCVAEELNGLADEIGATTGQLAKKILEMLEIMQALAAGDAFIAGRVDQCLRDFRLYHGIEHKEVTVATVEERHSEHHSESSRRVSVLKR